MHAEATATVPAGPPIALNGDPAEQNWSTITTAPVAAHRRDRTSEAHVLETATAPPGPRTAPDLDSADQKGNTAMTTVKILQKPPQKSL